jgi:sec-independent protein translocase protein TatB
MFEVGFTEIVLIFAIALLVLGPSRLPKLAADVGRWAGRARAMARQLRTQLEQEVHYDPLKDTSGPGRTIHTPAPAPAPAAPTAPDEARSSTPTESEPEPIAKPDRTDEPGPA